MRGARYVSWLSGLLALGVLLGGCVIEPAHQGDYGRGGYYGEPQEGYYDREHHRYWHDHRWHRCGREDRDDRDDSHCH